MSEKRRKAGQYGSNVKYFRLQVYLVIFVQICNTAL